jgi:hypothetical protein
MLTKPQEFRGLCFNLRLCFVGKLAGAEQGVERNADRYHCHVGAVHTSADCELIYLRLQVCGGNSRVRCHDDRGAVWRKLSCMHIVLRGS